MTPSVSPSHTFLYDTVEGGVWYVVRPKSGLGARAIPTAVKVIESFNKELKEAQKHATFPDGEGNGIVEATEPNDFITAYAPRYRYQVSVGVFRDRYVFSNLFFVHATPEVIKQFTQKKPYQIFFIHDHSLNIDENKDEYGNLTHDDYMRVTSRALADLYLSLNEYGDDIRVFTAHELQELKYTRKVLIVDGPLRGRECRIKSIEGKKRIIVDLMEGSMSIVVVMPDTHFQRM